MPLEVKSVKCILYSIWTSLSACVWRLSLGTTGHNSPFAPCNFSALVGNAADSWAAAQALALEGISSLQVIKRILSQIFDQKDATTEDQACLLLSQLSKHTVSLKSQEENHSGNG